MKRNTPITALIGFLVGYSSTFTLFTHSWTAIIAWGIVGVVIGAFTIERNAALWNGFAYGALLSIAFLVGVFGGTADKIPSYLALVAALAPLGAIGGAIASALGFYVRRFMTRGKSESSV